MHLLANHTGIGFLKTSAHPAKERVASSKSLSGGSQRKTGEREGTAGGIERASFRFSFAFPDLSPFTPATQAKAGTTA